MSAQNQLSGKPTHPICSDEPASSHAPTRIPLFARARPLYLRPANNSVRRAKRDHLSALALREKTILSLFTVSIQGRQTSLKRKPTWTAIIGGDFHEQEPCL
ncbi:hypothetical protein M0R45_007700 [Rubus argutus]|uniref:Uncharacterized protein n=1 Tax=Rubus argutus TaxID=59490 RepID=A0AAW1Y122_RUBAR